MMRKESGFTLLELAVVMAVIAIVSIVIIPNFITWLPKYKLKGAVLGLVADMQSTKLRAIKGNRTWAVVFDNVNKDRYWICSNPGVNLIWDGPTGGDTVEKTVDLARYNAGVTFTVQSANAFTTFTNRGMSRNTVEVDLTNANNSAATKVQTSLAGGIITDELQW
jgi:prepilin-type N-terminal cleavage/methylation domain-containing protein